MTQLATSKSTTTARWSILWLIAFLACAPVCANAYYYDDYYYEDYYADEYYYEEDAYYAYESEVYDAFTSPQTSTDPSLGINGRRNAIGHPSDPDAEHSEYPIGETWAMVVLALGVAGYTYIQQRKRKTATDKQNIN